MKKIIYTMALSATLLATSCTDYLDSDNLAQKSLETFYKTPTDINNALTGIYNALYVGSILSEEQTAANLLDNMMLGGGGADDRAAQLMDNFEDPLEDTYRDLWKESYNGIARANALIERTPAANFDSYFPSPAAGETFKKQAIGEAYFMRAFYYFRLAKFFGGVPLVITVDGDRKVPRSSYTETFAQIGSDLKMAIETLPATPFTSIPTADYGHATKWAAEAYMARVYLFYTGYMSNIEQTATATLPLAEGGSISAADVTTYLNDCMTNSGHALVSDYRNLWPYSYVNTVAGQTILPWAATNNLSWAGQDGATPIYGTGNKESMFVERFGFGDWGSGNKTSNRLALHNGIRDNSMVPFGQGWGWCTINPKLVSSWSDSDPRKFGSILEMGKADQGTDSYKDGKGFHETGYFNKKFTSLQINGSTGMFAKMYGWLQGDFQRMHAQDHIFMRYADVLLMHSEITQTATGLNAVRSRAGLGAIGYSLAAIKEERLHEFAFEGIHWFDLVRWGDVNTAFNDSFPVKNIGTVATYSAQYRAITKGLVSIPESEIRLSDGVYTQNPGW